MPLAAFFPIEAPRACEAPQSTAMGKKIYPWITLNAVLATGMLYAPPDLREKARTAIVKPKWELDEAHIRPGFFISANVEEGPWHG